MPGLFNTIFFLSASATPQETQAFTGLGIVGVFRYFFLFNSPDGFASSMFFYAKVIITSLAFVVDSRLAAWYALAAVTGHLLLPQPRVEPLPQLVTDLTAAALKERVLVSGNKVSWLVMFTTPWSSSCTAYAPVLADLAGRYASDTMAFGTLDVGVWGGVAKQLGIDINASSTQLPTWVLFEGGTELGRFPRAENATKKYAYSRKDLTKYFMLDDAESRRAGGNAGSGSVGSGSNKKKK